MGDLDRLTLQLKHWTREIAREEAIDLEEVTVAIGRHGRPRITVRFPEGEELPIFTFPTLTYFQESEAETDTKKVIRSRLRYYSGKEEHRLLEILSSQSKVRRQKSCMGLPFEVRLDC